jgi:hypothetical protein
MAADTEWPFTDPTNLAVFTTVAVINRTQQICLVSHDLDGTWQFLPRGGVSMRDARLISLKEAVDADQSLLVLADLPARLASYAAGSTRCLAALPVI